MTYFLTLRRFLFSSILATVQ